MRKTSLRRVKGLRLSVSLSPSVCLRLSVSLCLRVRLHPCWWLSVSVCPFSVLEGNRTNVQTRWERPDLGRVKGHAVSLNPLLYVTGLTPSSRDKGKQIGQAARGQLLTSKTVTLGQRWRTVRDPRSTNDLQDWPSSPPPPPPSSSDFLLYLLFRPIQVMQRPPKPWP